MKSQGDWRVCVVLAGMQCAATLENILELSQYLKVELPSDPETPFLRIYVKNGNQALEEILALFCPLQSCSMWLIYPVT